MSEKPELSRKSSWWIPKEDYYELKHFCHRSDLNEEQKQLIKNACDEADISISKWLIKGVTQGYTYDYLRYKLDIPCGRSMYYDRYRKFFWILMQKRKEL